MTYFIPMSFKYLFLMLFSFGCIFFLKGLPFLEIVLPEFEDPGYEPGSIPDSSYFVTSFAKEQ